MTIARYIIYGAGGIGASLGAQLHAAGCEVLLIARGAHGATIAERGLEYVTPKGRTRLALPVVAEPAAVRFRPDDAVILAMKTQDSLAAIEALAAVVDAEIPILCAQNGVENEPLALRRFRSLIGLAVWIPASFIDPGIVLNYAPHAPIECGGVPAGVDACAQAVARDLCAAGFAAEARADVLAWKYAKLLTNAVSTLDAICGGRAGLDDVVRRIKEEGMACYHAAGIGVVAPAEYEARVAFAIAAMGEIDGAPRAGGSGVQSLARGRGSIETDYINGEIVLLGRRTGVATPANEAVQRIARALADRRRPGPLSPAALRTEIDALERRH